MRGRPKLIKEPELEPGEYVIRTYEDVDTIMTWTYKQDDINRGPLSVDIKYKNGLDKPKNWNNLAKQAKADRKVNRQQRKLNNK